jgi:hypothetical protein
MANTQQHPHGNRPAALGHALSQLQDVHVIDSDPGHDAHALVMGSLPAGDVCLFERSEGPLTLSVYGSPWREGLLTIPAGELPQLLRATRARSASALVRECFAHGAARLGSFMDLLDELHTRYDFELLLDDGAPAVMVP